MSDRTYPSVAAYLKATDDYPEGRALRARLGISRQRMRLYVKRLAVPRPAMLRRLHEETGVPIEAFLYIKKQRRAPERAA